MGRISRPRRKSRPRRMIDDVIANTRKSADEWVKDLDSMGAAKMTHMEIVETLVNDHNLTTYQAQVLAHYFNKKQSNAR